MGKSRCASSTTVFIRLETSKEYFAPTLRRSLFKKQQPLNIHEFNQGAKLGWECTHYIYFLKCSEVVAVNFAKTVKRNTMKQNTGYAFIWYTLDPSPTASCIRLTLRIKFATNYRRQVFDGIHEVMTRFNLMVAHMMVRMIVKLVPGMLS